MYTRRSHRETASRESVRIRVYLRAFVQKGICVQLHMAMTCKTAMPSVSVSHALPQVCPIPSRAISSDSNPFFAMVSQIPWPAGLLLHQQQPDRPPLPRPRKVRRARCEHLRYAICQARRDQFCPFITLHKFTCCISIVKIFIIAPKSLPYFNTC